jgi:hypothetical protein
MLRAWLRSNFPRPAAEQNSIWHLTPEHIAAARVWRESAGPRSRRAAPVRPQRVTPATAPAATSLPPIRWDARFARSFRRQRFRGFVPLSDAVANRTTFLHQNEDELASAGVYAVFAPIAWTPKWKTRGRFTNVINPWSLARLGARWISDVELVYIGCAGATSSSRTLYERIDDLLKHGAGQTSTSGPHKGGERLWQCIGWETFTLAWKQTGPHPEPHNLEVAIGQRFNLLAGQLPFANVRL